MGITVATNASIVDRIRQIHGSGVANELIRFEASNDRWGFKSDGWVSNANYSVKRTTLLLFINHRSVESSNIKKAMEQTYATFLPKGGHPFIYLSLEIEPNRVDVNVHPTKREVNFLNEDEIIEIICDEIRARLGKVDTSRNFMTQSLLPGVKVPLASASGATPGEAEIESPGYSTPLGQSEKTPGSKTATKKPYENNLVRTDASARKITSMLVQTRHRSSDGLPQVENIAAEDMEYEYSEKEPTLCRLTTIKELRSNVRDAMHSDLTDIFAGHAYVGIVDERRRIAAIQGGVKLYLIDYGMLCNEFFYQIGLTDFGNFGAIRFNPVLNLEELLHVAAAHEKKMAEMDDEVDWDEVVAMVRQCLIERRAMLAEYFSLEISEEGEVLAIPLLSKGYMPSLAKLPQFLLRLGPHVDWTDEKGCFHSFLRELASFYVPESLPLPRTSDTDTEDGEISGTENPEITARRTQLLRAIENVIFPAVKARLVATKGLVKGVVEVANLKGLYRVFERC
jgi:DNA mismatch repair protein MLH1